MLDKKFVYQFTPQSLLTVDDFHIGKNLIRKDFLIDFMHMILCKHFFTNKRVFHLSSEILKKKYGAHYNLYVNWLLENKYLQKSSNYFVGKQSNSYYMTDKVKENIMRYYNTNKTVVKKWTAKYLSSLNYSKIDNNILTWLINSLEHITIDYDKAIEYINTLTDEDVIEKNKWAIDCIKNNTLYNTVDNYGRFHTNFTVLKSTIRKNCLRINGEETFEIDIKNSQPLFLIEVIEKTGYDMDDYKFVSELTFFRNLVFNGEIYDYLSNYDEQKRSRVKVMMYHVLFGRNKKDKYNLYFRKKFPCIFKWIIQYKKLKQDYKCLAYELQMSESNFLFNTVLKKVKDKYPTMSLFTIHDSIAVPISKKDDVEKIFYDTLREFISGLKKKDSFYI